MTFISGFFIVALFIYIALQVMYAFRKNRMHKKEAEFINSGTGPYGSGLSHGIVLNENGDGVKPDSRKSPAWYSRLV
jgi:hypothetical protein